MSHEETHSQSEVVGDSASTEENCGIGEPIDMESQNGISGSTSEKAANDGIGKQRDDIAKVDGKMSVELQAANNVTGETPDIPENASGEDFEVVTFVDKSGNDFKLLKAHGILLPVPDPGERNFALNIPLLPTLDVRDDDVLIACYPRSGTHWLQELIGMILSGDNRPMHSEKILHMVEWVTIETLNEMNSPRVINTHYLPRHLPVNLMKKMRIIHAVRNPKDVATSAYHFIKPFGNLFKGDHGDHLDLFLKGECSYGSWFDYENEFQQFCVNNPEVNPLLVYYEDLLMNPLQTLRRISEHLGLQREDELLEKINEACHIEKMRSYANSRRSEDEKRIFNHNYRKGKIGDWKNWFTVAENERFDKIYNEKMKDSWLNFDCL